MGDGAAALQHVKDFAIRVSIPRHLVIGDVKSRDGMKNAIGSLGSANHPEIVREIVGEHLRVAADAIGRIVER